MPELTALKDAAGSYSHFCPHNILQTSQTRFYLWFCLFLYKGLNWQIISLWSVFKLMVNAITDLCRTAVHIQCWYTKRRNVRVCFSQRTTLFKLKNYYDIVSKSPVPRHVLLKLLKCFVTKKTTTTKSTRIIPIRIIPKLLSFFSWGTICTPECGTCSKCLPASAR